MKKKQILAGAGLVALAAAAAGAVFLYGTETGKKKRKEIKSWTLKMKADVMDKIADMKDWSEDAYHDVVDSVAKQYKHVKNVDPLDIAALAQDLKGHWKNIKRQIEGGGKKRRTAKKK